MDSFDPDFVDWSGQLDRDYDLANLRAFFPAFEVVQGEEQTAGFNATIEPRPPLLDDVGRRIFDEFQGNGVVWNPDIEATMSAGANFGQVPNEAPDEGYRHQEVRANNDAFLGIADASVMGLNGCASMEFTDAFAAGERLAVLNTVQAALDPASGSIFHRAVPTIPAPLSAPLSVLARMDAPPRPQMLTAEVPETHYVLAQTAFTGGMASRWSGLPTIDPLSRFVRRLIKPSAGGPVRCPAGSYAFDVILHRSVRKVDIYVLAWNDLSRGPKPAAYWSTLTYDWSGDVRDYNTVTLDLRRPIPNNEADREGLGPGWTGMFFTNRRRTYELYDLSIR